MILSVNHIALYVQGTRIVYIPEWNLRKGEIYGLTGETGCGKSTIGKWLGDVGPVYWERRTENPDDGKSTPESDCEWNTRNHGDSSTLYLWQDAFQVFNPYVPVIKHFRDIWKNCGHQSAIGSFDELLDILQRLGIQDPTTLMNRKVWGISQGEAQRLAFVLGLIRPSSVRIYDEVFSNVDVPASRSMLQYLSEFCERTGTAAVIISHEQTLLREFTANISIVRNGILQGLQEVAVPAFKDKAKQIPAPFLQIFDLSVPGYSNGSHPGDILCQLPELSIGHSEKVGMSGPSGLGKTTLLHGLLGEHQLNWSRCLVSKDGIEGCDNLRELDIRYLPQSAVSAFNPAVRLRRSIREIQKVREVAEKDVMDLMEAFGLHPSLLDQLPSQLSGGEIQRVGIISVLLGEPDLVLLDESFSSVDESTRETIWSVIIQLQKIRGFALLVVSHDVSWLTENMNRVWEVLPGDPAL